MFESLSIHTAVHIVATLLFPPFLLGVINRVKARFGGRSGQPLLQAYFDLRKLIRQRQCLQRNDDLGLSFWPGDGICDCAWSRP